MKVNHRRNDPGLPSLGTAARVFCVAAALLLFSSSHLAAQPRIRLSRDVWDFGAIQRGQQVGHTLIIKNAGSEVLHIANIRSSCATCSVIEGYREHLEPGDSAEVRVTYTAEGKKGPVAKTVYIDCNDPDQPRAIFRLTGTVQKSPAPEIVVDPNPWYAGAISADSTSSGRLMVTNDGLSDLAVTAIEAAGCLVREPSLPAIGPGDSGFVQVGFDLKSLIWEGERFILFRSNDPFQPTVTVKIFGETAIDSADTTPVCALIFLSRDCSECTYVMNEIVTPLQKLYSGFQVRTVSVDNPRNYDLLTRLEKQYQDTRNEIPVLFIGEAVFGGRKEIERGLRGRIDDCRQRGGCHFPECREGEAYQRKSVKKKIHIAYFYQPGCKQCDRVSHMLRSLRKRYEKLNIKEFNIASIENKLLDEAIAELLNIPEEQRLVTPALVVGDQYLIKDDLIDAKVQGVIEHFRDTGSSCSWEEAEALRADATLSIVERFKAFGPMTVIMGGLVDGINPCAFATIIFFLSYLAFIGRRGKDLLCVGAAFTVAVFITYLLIGLGFYHFIQSLKIFNVVSMVIYVVTATLAFILGAYSIYDIMKIRRGRVSDISLQLPEFLKRRIHKTIREKTRMRRFVLAAFITGWVVSLLELACTGQVYLPTICFVTGVPELRLHAFLYLVIYNLMFILPLCFVFGLTYYGTTSDQIAVWMKRHILLMKTALAVFFFCLGGFLLSVIF